MVSADTPEGDAWQRLASVPDPEIPVVSIVELGIVRAVARDGAGWRVTLTPTYSGCPAMDMIARDVERVLGTDGNVRVDTALAPAWSTDWIAPEARERLRGFGIAPPAACGAPGAAAVDVAGISPLRRARPACPRCGSAATSLVSQFGSTACKAHYRCDACREPFDYFKPH
ncbi:MAG: phenylacetate-CoA oxygenase subunit PaaJ [Proteobacteria bacterium]|nr:phenylacetate-CoA oxygenase subunit PaaJ [Pseudomonadota bacterium]